jgi:hypothetical protein
MGRRGGMTITVTDISAKLRDHGLRPIVDAVLDVVYADCPSCHAQDSDPLELYRPLRVVPRGGGVTFLCAACDVRREVRRHV